jgi:predicted Rossmann fold flavoprotein
VVAVLEKNLVAGKVEVRTGAKVRGLVTDRGKIVGVKVGTEILIADAYVLATGGLSRPETGSTGDGFGWLRDLGLKVQSPTPTVVPLAVRDTWIKSLAGVALDNVKVTFAVAGGQRIVIKGRILCTHFGLSGPLIMNAAAKVADLLHSGPVTTTIDLSPSLDLGAMDKKVISIFDEHKNKELKNVLKYLVPAGTVTAILNLLSNLDHDKKVHSISKTERKAIVHRLKALPAEVTGLMGYERAVVADGGVVLNEIDGKTMRSRKYPNLYITGDLLHINRPSGGYSLQLCWTSGWVAGSNV